MSDTLRPTNNHILVAIPERYRQRDTGPKIHLIAGEDAMQELIARIKVGANLQIETEDEQSIPNLVRTGQVLAIPPQLTDQMVLCAAGNNKVRTFADITPVVEVGDTVYLDHSCLTDENEVLPGIYRVSYAAVICVIHQFTFDKNPHNGGHYTELDCLVPVGGYVLLSRVWADDCTDYEVDDRMQKVRWNEAGTLISEYNVAPLPNEGVVKWVGEPLKGALNELHPGQRVVFDARQALVETICGVEYIAVRHDYCLAVVQSKYEQLYKEIAVLSSQQMNEAWGDELKHHEQNTFTKEFQRLPLESDSYNA